MSIVGVGDYYGNGTSDILWRNPTNGEVGMWQMSGGVPTWHDLGASTASYHIVT